ncbi:MAG: PAS domain S-box protein [Pleurocapsa minor GSE-CHR-MK-17-07R]|jgi:PAS domain S-box-containing protein|nr:PAS domain S-box protein [Pleurocapsa minor GSE-CHR-MK 17-07R]
MSDSLSDQKLIARLLFLSKLAGALVIAIGALALAGWIFGIDVLASLQPGLVTMKINTALCFILAGTGLICLRTRPRVTQVTAAIVLVIAGLVGAQFVFNVNLGIDELFARDTTIGIAPGRMSPITVVCFILISAAMLVMTLTRRVVLGQTLALTAILLSLLVTLAFMYDLQELNSIFLFSFVAFNTIVAFVILGTGVFFAFPDEGLAHLFSVDSAGGYMARWLLPVAVVMPIIVGFFRLQGQNAGLYGTEFGTALFTLSSITIITLITGRIAVTLHRVDVERKDAVDAKLAAYVDLEQKVNERTYDLTQANEKLAREIIQRKQAENQFRALLQSAPDGIIVQDESGSIALSNQHIETMLGYTKEALARLSIKDLMPQPDYDRLVAFRDALASDNWQHSGSSLQVRGLRKDGSVFPIEVSLSHVDTPKGEMIFGSIRDITDRQEYEQTLHLSASLQENVSDAVVATDMSFRIQSWNRAAERIYGWRVDEVVGKPVGDILLTRHTAQMDMAVIQNELLTRGYYQGEYLQTHRDGTEINILGSTNLLKSPDGTPYGIVSVNHDITERKRAEQEARRLQVALDNMQEGAQILGFDWHFLYQNDAAARQGHLNKGQVAGRTFMEMFPGVEETPLFDTLRRVMEERTPEHIETLFQFSDGTSGWFDIIIQPVPEGIFVLSTDVTKRKQAEQEAMRLQQALDNMQEGAQIVGFDWRYIYQNETAARQGQQPKGRVLGYTMMEMYPGIDQTQMFDVLRHCMEQRTPDHIETLFQFADGTSGWFDVSVQPVPEGIFILSSDIGQRKQAEAEARRLQVALDNMQEGAQIVDFNWRYVYLNDAVSVQGRRDKSELLGRTMMEAYPGIDETPLFDILRRCMEGRTPERFENHFTYPDGTTGWFDLSLQPVPEGIFILSTDVSQRKAAEEALRRQEEKLQTIFNLLPVGAAVMSEDRRILQANVAMERILQVSSDGLKNAEYRQKRYIHSDSSPMFDHEHPTMRALNDLKPVYDVEMGIIQPDESLIWVNVSAAPLPDNQGVITIMADTTRRKEIEMALQRTNDQLQHANEEVQRFAYIVSHDLRGPLINLKGFSEILRGAVEQMTDMTETVLPVLSESQARAWNAAVQEKIPTALRFINIALDRMDRFTTAILALSRMGNRSLTFEPVAVDEMVQQIINSYAMQIEEQGIEIIVDPLPTVEADRLSLDQILGNIIANAIKYLDKSRAGRIHVFAEQDAQQTVFHVADNGRGIAEMHRDKVFAPFRRGINDVEGEGMGLAYVQALIRRHNGRIWFDTTPGIGTTFSFSLPVNPKEQ